MDIHLYSINSVVILDSKKKIQASDVMVILEIGEDFYLCEMCRLLKEKVYEIILIDSLLILCEIEKEKQENNWQI